MAGGRGSINRGGGSSRSVNNLSSTPDNDVTMSEDVEIDNGVTRVDGKMFIEPDGNSFKPKPDKVVRLIPDIIKKKFEGAWPSWKKVPIGVRNIWFEEFKKRFYWHPNNAKEIRDIFEYRGQNLLKGIFFEERKTIDEKPTWLASEDWDALKNHWNGEKFKIRSETAKKNRSMTCGVGSSLHTGGSIPTAEIKRRLEIAKGEKITALELFAYTHKRKSNQEWVDATASQAYESFQAKRQNIELTEDSCENSDTEAWVKEYTTKKGGVYGLGSEGTKYTGSCSYTSIGRATQNIPPLFTIEEVNETIRKALEAQEQKHDEKLLLALEEQKKSNEEQKKNNEELKVMMAALMKTVEKQKKKLKKKKKSKSSSEKTKVSSHNSFVGKEKRWTDDTSSSSSD